MLLSPFAGAAENSQAVMNRFSRWNGFSALEGNYRNYLASRKSFQELMDEGHRAYERGDARAAELSFLSALAQQPSDFAPYYYLGLLSYDQKNYQRAESYYRESLGREGDKALVNYALGVNAAAAGRTNAAVEFLRQAAALDPPRYRTRVEDLLRRIRG